MLGTVVAARDTKVKQKRKITALWSLQTINMNKVKSHKKLEGGKCSREST